MWRGCVLVKFKKEESGGGANTSRQHTDQSKNTILALQANFHALGDEIACKDRNADPQVHKHAILLMRPPRGQRVCTGEPGGDNQGRGEEARTKPRQ